MGKENHTFSCPYMRFFWVEQGEGSDNPLPYTHGGPHESHILNIEGGGKWFAP